MLPEAFFHKSILRQIANSMTGRCPSPQPAVQWTASMKGCGYRGSSARPCRISVGMANGDWQHLGLPNFR